MWKTLNRLRSGVGRRRSYMARCGYASDIMCECGQSEQTVQHVLYNVNYWINPAAYRIWLMQPRQRWCSDVGLKTRVLVSRRLEDKNESFGLGLGSWSLGLAHERLTLVLDSVSKKKSCSFQEFCCNSWRQWARHTTAFCERQ